MKSKKLFTIHGIMLAVTIGLLIGAIIGFYVGKGYVIAMMRENISNLCKLLV